MNCMALAETVTGHLQNQFYVEATEQGCVMVTPSLNADVAPVEIYIEEKNGLLHLSDAGESLHYLFIAGMQIDSKQLQKEISLIADINQVCFGQSKLSVEAAPAQLGDAVQQMTAAIQATTYLAYKTSHRVTLKFEEEVERLLGQHRIRYETKYQIQGMSAPQTIPIYINSNRNVLLEPVLAQTASSARNKARLIGFKWHDLREKYGDAYHYNVILSDKTAEQRAAWADDGEAIKILETLSTRVLHWSTDQGVLVSSLS